MAKAPHACDASSSNERCDDALHIFRLMCARQYVANQPVSALQVSTEKGVEAKDMLTASFIGVFLEDEAQQRLQGSL